MGTSQEIEPGGLPAPVSTATRTVFRAGAAIRDARAFHPRGVTYSATATIDAPDGEPGLPVGTHDAVVRFSRGAGLPDALPDLHGIAVKLVAVHGVGDQDLLLTSSWRSVVGRRLLRPGRAFTAGWYSTILPYDAAGRRLVVGARFASAVPVVPLGAVDDVVAPGRCTVELLVAPPRGGWTRVGRVVVAPGARPPAEGEAIAFDPSTTAPGFEPAGLLNRLRPAAYEGSRAGRSGA